VKISRFILNFNIGLVMYLLNVMKNKISMVTLLVCVPAVLILLLDLGSIKKEFRSNAKIINIKNFEMVSWEDTSGWIRGLYIEADYLKALEVYNRTYKGQSFEITYMSDGLKVKGVITVPRGFSPEKKYPVIIYNRGGNRDFGAIYTTFGFVDNYSSKGYIVFASQYRGVYGGEGRDEFGGAEVDDIINLISLSKEFRFVDKKNYFMIGASRGGTMNYLVLKRGIRFNATVSLAAVSNEFLALENRLEMEEVYKELVPNYLENREEELRKRSVIFWVDKINSPLLLLHGSKDWRVSHVQSTNLLKVMREKDKIVKIKIYQGEGHSLSGVWDDVQTEIHSWLQRFTSNVTK
jgi:dipeptidyl aminopeptidase/acylaminoacyl peptidase